jgi:hypothetical protein
LEFITPTIGSEHEVLIHKSLHFLNVGVFHHEQPSWEGLVEGNINYDVHYLPCHQASFEFK